MPMTTAAELSMSLPMEEAITNKDALADNINLGTSPDERPYILASFLTGISAFVIGAVAMFVKMRQIHSREVEAQEEASAAQAREVVTMAVAVASYPAYSIGVGASVLFDDVHGHQVPAKACKRCLQPGGRKA